MSYKCQGNNISMFSNFKGGWLTKRWENLAPGKLVCLDSSSCNVFAGNKCNLYSFDPANGCRRSAGPVGQRNQDGCFDPDAKITMADGSKRAIKFIRAGDKVFNPMTKKSMTVETVIKGPEKAFVFSGTQQRCYPRYVKTSICAEIWARRAS